MKKLVAFIFCLVMLKGGAFAQTESTLYFMNSLPQVVEANPAIVPRYRTSIGLPILSSVGAVYSNNGFSYNDMITKADGVTKLDLSRLTGKMTENNYVQAAAQADLFRIGLRINPRLYLMASSTERVFNRTMIPKGLASLLVDGNGPLVGSYSNTSPSEEAYAMLVTSLGLSYQLNDRLTIGGRLKYLIGQANATTDASSLIVQVNDSYQITASGQATFRTSGFYNLNRPNYNAAEHAGDYLKNNGWGADLGATYKVTDKFTLGASLTDIGYINWKNNTYQYTMDPATSSYTFTGIDVSKLANNLPTYLSSQIDSLKNKFQMKEASTGSYKTMLPAKFYLSGTYEIIRNLNVGLLYFGEKLKERLSSGITAAVNKNFGKKVSTSLTYTASNRSYNNIGLGVSFNLTPVQLYFVGDNLLGAATSVATTSNLNSYLNGAQIITLRAGLNIVFGWDKSTSKKDVAEDDSKNLRTKKSKPKVKATFGRTPPKPKTRNKVGK